MVEVSIIVPCFCRADLTEVCIQSILTYCKKGSHSFELILVQEGEDKEITKLFEEYKNIRVPSSDIKNPSRNLVKFAHNKTPKGYSGALNTGLELATGKYVCFMNNDTVAVPGWMDEMIACAKENENTGLVVPTFWGSGGRQSIDWNDGERFDFVDNIYGIIGVCFLIPRDVLDLVGKWDEDFFHGGEDFDIAYRIQQAGYSIFVARNSFIYHYGGASTRELFGNDFETVRKNVYDRMKQFADKHGLKIEDIIEKLNTSNKI